MIFRRYFLLSLLLWLILPIQAFSLDLPRLNLFSTDSVQLQMQESNKPLEKLLVEELARQRKSNLQLKQQTDLVAKSRLESRLLTKKLESEGYYDARVKVAYHQDKMVYEVYPRQLYRIKSVRVQAPESVAVPDSVLALNPGSVLRAENVLNGKKTLSHYLINHYCLLQVDVTYRVVLASAEPSAEVVYTVAESPSVVIGDIVISGLSSVQPSYIRERMSVNTGDCFKRRDLDQLRITLLQTNLLASVGVRVGEPVDGRVDLNLFLTERHHRTFTAGAGYQSEEGLGISLGWEHRNLFGRAQRLKTEALLAQNIQRLATDLTMPYFRNSRQKLAFYSDAERASTDAYKATEVGVGVELTRRLNRRLNASAGLEIGFSGVEAAGESEDYALFSVPLMLEYDWRDNKLDPLRGWVAVGSLRPYVDLYDPVTDFIKSAASFSGYATFSKIALRPTLGMRGSMGNITGEQREHVPANERFYVGGGGSVRGYPYQSLGPYEDGKPAGGLSFTELSFEARMRWGEHWGAVVFLDGGYSYREVTPQLDEKLWWGTGLGLRYYTSFAPIRFDIGFPLDKREGLDDDFQLYISIGQAF
ncbi:autotransporter assembly complex protein TamA [Teredinibacter haidensis]|uniref:autotransporter assembly complex protein TamA n=1 Tax=Teredinibacter haidensis TaxID=2731755 RepID=UPI000948FBE6|nr:BamA/TamA family outer membrane protein [Teredinibacter haidensis]